MFISPVYFLRLVIHMHPSVFSGFIIRCFSNARGRCRNKNVLLGPCRGQQHQNCSTTQLVFESYRMTFNELTFCKVFTDFRISRGVLELNPREERDDCNTVYL